MVVYLLWPTIADVGTDRNLHSLDCHCNDGWTIVPSRQNFGIFVVALSWLVNLRDDLESDDRVSELTIVGLFKAVDDQVRLAFTPLLPLGVLVRSKPVLRYRWLANVHFGFCYHD